MACLVLMLVLFFLCVFCFCLFICLITFFFIIKHDVNETYVNKPLEIWWWTVKVKVIQSCRTFATPWTIQWEREISLFCFCLFICLITFFLIIRHDINETSVNKPLDIWWWTVNVKVTQSCRTLRLHGLYGGKGKYSRVL